jgi:hypothetical protein
VRKKYMKLSRIVLQKIQNMEKLEEEGKINNLIEYFDYLPPTK